MWRRQLLTIYMYIEVNCCTFKNARCLRTAYADDHCLQLAKCEECRYAWHGHQFPEVVFIFDCYQKLVGNNTIEWLLWRRQSRTIGILLLLLLLLLLF